MRIAFRDTLIELAERDERIILLTADLGYSVLEPFAARFPGRFFNVGVAEQNMLGLATGLAEGGLVPFVYSIATFATMRPYEFIRNGAVGHNLPVRIVGVGGGFDYGVNGATHHALEDIALMRAQPGMTVIVPADDGQTRGALRGTLDHPGPVYFRVGRDGTAVPGLSGRFRLGRLERIRSGKDVAIIVAGSIAHVVVDAAHALGESGIHATVVVAASLSPAPSDDLAEIVSGFSEVVTVEEHYATGGLGSLVCEVAAEHGVARVTRCGVHRRPAGGGSQAYLRGVAGLSASEIARTVEACLDRPPAPSRAEAR